MNRELPHVQSRFWKGRGTRDQTANKRWIPQKLGNFRKTSTLVSLTTYTKTFDCLNHNKLWKILRQTGIPDHLTCLLRNLYAGQEATVRTGHGTTVWFQIGKGVRQGCILSPWLFMQSTSCEMLGWMKHKLESRSPIKIAIMSICRWDHANGRKRRGN